MRRSLFVLVICAGAALVLTGAGMDPSPNPEMATTKPTPSAVAAGAPMFELDWLSVNGGGATQAAGSSFELGLTVGQPAAGYVSGRSFELGLGIWYGAAGAACPIEMSGDVNINGIISASDIIVLVNYVFKAGPEPLPCLANGDVNCNGLVSSSDIITLVISVFKAGPPPCNVCDLIPAVWSCP